MPLQNWDKNFWILFLFIKGVKESTQLFAKVITGDLRVILCYPIIMLNSTPSLNH